MNDIQSKNCMITNQDDSVWGWVFQLPKSLHNPQETESGVQELDAKI